MKIKRNQLCPCGSGRKFKKCCLSSGAPLLSSAAWQDEKGIHHLAPGKPPSQEELEQMTKDYQEKIRQSPMWDEIVNEYGHKKAEELLKQCKAELG